MSDAPPRYAFRDSPAARDRLALVAALFEPTTRALLARVAGHACRRALDLGCGPGHATRLLAECFPDADVVGLDRSEAFLAAARAQAAPRTRFAPADVAGGPLPDPPADVVYARFVLSHLPDRAAVLARWFAALAPGGVLLVEEPDAIETADPVFRAYLAITTGLMADRGGDLFAGRALSADAAPLGGRVLHDAVATVAPRTGDVAAVFALNLQVWRDDPWVAARHAPAALDALADGLAARRAAPTRGTIVWRLRQLAVARP